MKKLTNYINDLGRVIAFYPGLKKITGSTNASILLCQFLYWSDKTRDNGWIYKTADEIEEETGLTYYEQKTAKNILVYLGIIESEFKRLDHTSCYKVNQDVLNTLWEEVDTKTKVVKEIPTGLLKGEQLSLPIEDSISGNILAETSASVITSSSPTAIISDSPIVKKSRVEKKGDWLDAMITFNQSPQAKKLQDKKEIKELFESRLHINLNTPAWSSFIDFIYMRQEKFKESPSRFIDWALSNGFDAVYWNANKMMSVYPQAFVNNKADKPDKAFVEKLPERKEESYAPMPKDLLKKKTLD